MVWLMENLLVHWLECVLEIDGILVGVFDGDSVNKTFEYIHLFVRSDHQNN